MDPRTCDHGILVLLADGELPAGEQERLAHHLGECLPCRRALEALGDLPPVLPRIRAEPELLAGMKAEVLASVRHARRTPREGISLLAHRLFTGSVTLPKPLVWLAAAAILLMSVRVPPGETRAGSRLVRDGIDGVRMVSLQLN